MQKPGHKNSKSKRFVIGDIHGAHKALCECLDKCSFNNNIDSLICLGDICDGWPETNKVIDDLVSIKNLVLILGNHDYWALEWMYTGKTALTWLRQGGKATISSYIKGVPESHKNLMQNARLYYETDKEIFVHAGIQKSIPLQEQSKEVLLWDRTMIDETISGTEALNENDALYREKTIFIGHTPTLNFGSEHPIHAGNIWLMDTGAGWANGKLSIMNIDTFEIFQSEMVQKLYPDFNGRGSKHPFQM